jgi:methyl-accepting chemotaxis protein
MYKYIGVSRKDRPGVIQVGFNAESLSKFKLQVGGFAVVATEVYRLADNSKTSAKNIASLIRDIRKSMAETVKAMKESSTEVDIGYAKAVKANESLQAILESAGEVTHQAAEAASSALAMNQYAEQLVMAVDSVSAVVEQNTAATEQMAASSGEVNQAIENIASVSEENSAAVEEVSASTEEVKAQVDLVTKAANDLRVMSESLKAVITEFRLSSNSGEGEY